MRASLLFTALTAIVLPTIAALPPTSQAPLERHLNEVNAQWRVQAPDFAGGQTLVGFENDAQRIAQHLHMVSERLTARSSAGLTHSQLENRLTLLHKLDRYADHGLFPQNKVLPYRNPVFIDPIGTACAVGQLMIESGHRDLAERISKEMNLAYVLDMPTSKLWPEIAAWAVEHGFTAGELAWIQPAYQPNYDWFPLGGGTNGVVRLVKKLNNGDLLVAGEFTEAGGVAANNIAIWNGTNYTALGPGLQGPINAAVEHNGELYVGGAMLGGVNDLAKWNGSAWSYSTLFDGKYPLVNALHVHDGLLYAAGAMSGFAGNTDFVQVFDGAQWVPVGSPFNGPVLTLATHNSALVAGGAFTGILSPNLPPPAMYVAQMGDVDWAQLGDGLDAPVRALLDVGGTLYAGGDLYINVVPTFGMARIIAGGATWEELLPNHENYMPSDLGLNWIGSLTEFNGTIYFGGKFPITPGVGTYGNNLGAFIDIDVVAALIVVDAPVNAVAMSGSSLVIGGDFSTALPYIGILDLSSSVNDGTLSQNSVRVAPNPVADELIISLASARSDVTPELFDATGRSILANTVRTSNGYRLDVRTLRAGAYVLRIATDQGVTSASFVKE